MADYSQTYFFRSVLPLLFPDEWTTPGPLPRFRQHESKTAVALSTAAATLRQLVMSIAGSVKEFLTVDWLLEPIRDASRYHIRLEAAPTILAQACFDVLLGLDVASGRLR